MKLKPKMAPIKEIKLPVRQNLLDLSAHLNSVLIDRTVAVRGIILGLLTQQHVMLEGVPGVAKSMLAESVFRSISGATVFEKQLMKGTKPEEVFGPLNLPKYQKETVWEHNITGKLPDCHFAFLDEVYRASDMLLPGCLGILNERKFENGGKQVQCPLISAVGTTNFVTDSADLTAFNDRWLIWVNIAPIAAINSRVKMLRGFLDRLEASPPRKEFLTLGGLLTAIADVKDVEVSKPIADAYAALCSTLGTLLGAPVSDRRFCQAIRLAQAHAYLNNLDTVNAEALAETAYGLIKRGDQKQETAFATAYTQSVGNIEQAKAEDAEIIQLNEILTKLTSKYTGKAQKTGKSSLLAQTSNFVNMLQIRGEEFVSADAEATFKEIRAKADSLLIALKEGQGDTSAPEWATQTVADPDLRSPKRGKELTLTDLIDASQI